MMKSRLLGMAFAAADTLLELDVDGTMLEAYRGSERGGQGGQEPGAFL